mgnify:CR=1 FL=1
MTYRSCGAKIHYTFFHCFLQQLIFILGGIFVDKLYFEKLEDLKEFLNKEIRVELTPKQQKMEDEINEFLHQEITWGKVKDFLFKEVCFNLPGFFADFLLHIFRILKESRFNFFKRYLLSDSVFYFRGFYC